MITYKKLFQILMDLTDLYMKLTATLLQPHTDMKSGHAKLKKQVLSFKCRVRSVL